MVLGKTLFLHRSAPKGWWEDYIQLTARAPAPTASVARLSIGDFTLTEVTQLLEPLGQDRQAIDIHYKHGIRDLLGCPIAGRWLLAYWSKKVITLGLEQRAFLFLAATFAAIRLEKFQQPVPGRVPKGADITARELAVLRALSIGLRPAEVAKHLELGTETIRTHIKKAEVKLGVATPEAACCAAIRLRLIP
jgi:LuxR family quorum sensing-dependent transcriptional regulator